MSSLSIQCLASHYLLLCPKQSEGLTPAQSDLAQPNHRILKCVVPVPKTLIPNKLNLQCPFCWPCVLNGTVVNFYFKSSVELRGFLWQLYKVTRPGFAVRRLLSRHQRTVEYKVCCRSVLWDELTEASTHLRILFMSTIRDAEDGWQEENREVIFCPQYFRDKTKERDTGCSYCYLCTIYGLTTLS